MARRSRKRAAPASQAAQQDKGGSTAKPSEPDPDAPVPKRGGGGSRLADMLAQIAYAPSE